MTNTTENKLVRVRYTIPVFAEIDITTGTIVAVRVDDESISAPDLNGFEYDDCTDVTDEQIKARALEIAETQSWPRWEFGF